MLISFNLDRMFIEVNTTNLFTTYTVTKLCLGVPEYHLPHASKLQRSREGHETF